MEEMTPAEQYKRAKEAVIKYGHLVKILTDNNLNSEIELMAIQGLEGKNFISGYESRSEHVRKLVGVLEMLSKHACVDDNRYCGCHRTELAAEALAKFKNESSDTD